MGFRQHGDVRDFERIEFLDGMRPAQGRRKVMVADQQQGADTGFGKTDDAFAPFALESGRRGTVFVGIPGEDDQVDFFRYGSLDDGIEGFQEIQHAQRQARFGVVPAVVGHINVRIGEVQEFHNKLAGWSDSPQRKHIQGWLEIRVEVERLVHVGIGGIVVAQGIFGPGQPEPALLERAGGHGSFSNWLQPG